MPLTPLDIHNKEFSRSFKGYNEDQVNEFLDHVIKDFEQLIRDKQTLEDRVRTLEERLSHFEKIEESLSKSLIVAQDTAEEVRQNARKEAQLITKEAEKNADRIINEALAKSRKIMLDIDEVRNQAHVFRTRFRSLIQAQLEMLDETGWDEIAQAKPREEE